MHGKHANNAWQLPPEPGIVTPCLNLELVDTSEPRNTANMVINPTYLAQRTRSCTPYTRRNHWKGLNS